MQRAVRSSVTAGVALLGSGVIAASLIAPPVPDIHLPALHVDATALAAAVSPIEAYQQVFETARANLQALADAGDPGAVLKQIVANQVASVSALGNALGASGSELFTAITKTAPDQLRTALTALAAGDVEAATNALLFTPLALAQPLINLLPAIEKFDAQPLQNLLNVGKVFTDPVFDSMVAVGLLGPVINALGATGAATQNVIDAVRAGDPQQVVNAILTGPATIADGILNGGFGPDLGGLIPGGLTVIAGGLFTKSAFVITPDGQFVLNVGGPIDTLQTVAKQIANALKPPATTSAAAVKAKALPAASTTADASTTTETTTSTTGEHAQAMSSDVPATSVKPLQHKTAATTAGKNGNGKADSANGPKHPHKAGGRGHSAR